MLLCNPGTPPQPHTFCGSEDPSFYQAEVEGLEAWRRGSPGLQEGRR